MVDAAGCWEGPSIAGVSAEHGAVLETCFARSGQCCSLCAARAQGCSSLGRKVFTVRESRAVSSFNSM